MDEGCRGGIWEEGVVGVPGCGGPTSKSLYGMKVDIWRSAQVSEGRVVGGFGRIFSIGLTVKVEFCDECSEASGKRSEASKEECKMVD